MQHTKRGVPECGLGLILAIIITAVLAFMSLQTFSFVKQYVKIHSEEIVSRVRTFKTIGRALSVYENTSERTPPLGHLEFHHADYKEAGITFTKRFAVLCGDRSSQILQRTVIDGTNLSSTTEFPLFDYNSLLSRAQRCATSERKDVRRTRSGFLLTPSAVQSEKTCVRLNLERSPQSSIDGNLELEDDLDAPGSGNSTLFIGGYADLVEVRAREFSLIVAALGDIHIKSLACVGATPCLITVISASGSVVIDNIKGQFQIKLIGKEGVYSPPIHYDKDNGLMPPLLEKEFVGFTR